MGIDRVAALWALAEATLWFIVPDVWITRRAIRGTAAGLNACAWALGGALVGGGVMFAWGMHDYATALHTIDRLPAISPEMIQSIGQDVEAHGASAMLIGPLRGQPYKLYAVWMGHHLSGPLSLGVFLLWSVPARLLRFLALAVLARLAALGLRRWCRIRPAALNWTHGLLWLLFYVIYFAAMPN